MPAWRRGVVDVCAGRGLRSRQPEGQPTGVPGSVPPRPPVTVSSLVMVAEHSDASERAMLEERNGLTRGAAVLAGVADGGGLDGGGLDGAALAGRPEVHALHGHDHDQVQVPVQAQVHVQAQVQWGTPQRSAAGTAGHPDMCAARVPARRALR
ncbi:hypothetical protein JCM4914_56460 [Streptomyces platensis subsp. malvinus]